MIIRIRIAHTKPTLSIAPSIPITFAKNTLL